MKKILTFLFAVCIVLQTTLFAYADETIMETYSCEEKSNASGEGYNLDKDNILQESILDENDDNEEVNNKVDEPQVEEFTQEFDTEIEDIITDDTPDETVDNSDSEIEESEIIESGKVSEKYNEEEALEELEYSEPENDVEKEKTEEYEDEDEDETRIAEEFELYNAGLSFSPIDDSIWFDSERECPFDTGYELYEETEFIRNNSMNGQIFLSEDSYEGRFALGIHAKNEVENQYSLLPVKITDVLITDATVPMYYAGVFGKANSITLYVKPKYNAQWIAFYVYADDESETNYKILGDDNNDGMYVVGTDIAQGQWNKISLNLNNIEALSASSFINSLYVCTNDDSQWCIDNLDGEYNETISDVHDITKMAKDNLTYYSDELTFTKDEDTEIYDITPVITTISRNIENKLTGIDIESKYLDFSTEYNANTISDNLLPSDITKNNNSELWHFGDNGSISGEKIKIESNTSPEDVTYLDISTVSDPSKRKKLILKSGFSATSGYMYIRNENNFSWKLLAEDGKIYEIILPANTEKIYFISKYIATISSVELFELSDNDNSISSMFVNSALVDRTVFTDTSLNDVYDPSTMLYEGIGEPSQIFGNNSPSINYSANSTDYVIVKVINPYNDIRNYTESTSRYATITAGGKKYYLEYGENEYLFYGKAISTITINDTTDRNGILVTEISKYSYFKDIKINQTTTAFLEGNSSAKFGNDANNIYYISDDGTNSLYVYNIDNSNTKKINKSITSEILAISPNGQYAVFREEASDFIYLYDNESSDIGIVEKIEEKIQVSNNGICTGLYVDSDEQYYLASTDSENDLELDDDEVGSLYVDPTSEYAIINGKNAVKAYRKQNRSWREIGTILEATDTNSTSTTVPNITTTPVASGVVYDGKGKAYISKFKTIYSVDLSSLSKKTLSIKASLCSCTDDERILVMTDAYMEVYDPATNKSEIISNKNNTTAVYSYEKQRMLYIPDDVKAVYSFSTLDKDNYVLSLLSFDGGKSWKSYKNNTWVTISDTNNLSFDTFVKYGITSNNVSNIPESAFAELQKTQEIYSVKIAMLVHARDNKYSPTISAIKLHTSPGKAEALFGVHGEYFDKSDYSKINTIYPIETKPSYAENYYFLAIGDDAVFTYKNGSFFVVENTVENMVCDIEDSWIDIKQQGMTAAELSEISSEALTELLISDYDNDGFTIINCIKTTGDTTKEIIAEYRINAENRYSFGIADTMIVTLSDGNEKTFNNMSEEEIQAFFIWFEKRQNGMGGNYYGFDTPDGKIFINYNNISSVEVSA